MKRIDKFIILAIATLLILLTTSCAQTIAIYAPPQGEPYSVKEMKERWAMLQPDHSGPKYSAAPQTSSPYSAGSLQESYLLEGLNMANFMRYLARLPHDLELDAGLNSKGQHGAVLLTAHGSLSHTPPKPADMAQAFYDIGYSSTSSSNIAVGFSELHSSISEGYMRDEDPGNITRLGHRRWILNPPLKKIGFGEASGFMVMQVFDKSRSTAFDYNYIAWPAKGNFPTKFFKGNDPWSVTVNPAKYSQPVKAEVTVRLRNLTSGAEWNFSAADNNTSGKYFNVDTGGYGVNNCIIFRPAGISSFNEGDSYEVTINGVKSRSGNATIITFVVNFFKIS